MGEEILEFETEVEGVYEYDIEIGRRVTLYCTFKEAKGLARNLLWDGHSLDPDLKKVWIELDGRRIHPFMMTNTAAWFGERGKSYFQVPVGALDLRRGYLQIWG